MISVIGFQEAVVAKLLGNSNLVSLVGAEIREADYQATNFAYPNVRVSRPEIGETVSFGCQYPVSFTVSIGSKQPSSQECSNIFDYVVAALEGRLLETIKIRSTEVIYRGCNPAFRDSVDSWRADAYFSTRAVDPS